MRYRIWQLFSRFVLLGVLVLSLFLGLGAIATRPAAAAIGQIQEAPDLFLYKSLYSLRDRAGNSWQVVLFKQVKGGQVASVNLRLVGFPGLAKFSHPAALTIKTATGKLFKAEDMFAETAPAANVGQYDVKDILLQLPATEQLRLYLPTVKTSAELPVPPPVVLEWQTIVIAVSN
ncbi:MAG: DUF3122 domain-containing protein [Oscillatoria sp. SIO1A7]|nr:DUF3122 domain-containing protein [Oscillatoria sp. SIO1A7]